MSEVIKTSVTENQEKAERQPLKLNIDHPEEFTGAIKCKYLTTLDLSKRINSMLRPLFKDYKGCFIEPATSTDPYAVGPVNVRLYFLPMSNNREGQYTAFVEAGTSFEAPKKVKSNGIIAAALKMNAVTRRSESYEPTQELVDIIYYNFLAYGVKSKIKPTVKDFMEKGIVTESVAENRNVYGSSQLIYSQINGVDIARIIQVRCGDKKGKEYMVIPTRAIPTATNTATTNWWYCISELDRREVERMANEMGYMDRTSSIPMYSE